MKGQNRDDKKAKRPETKSGCLAAFDYLFCDRDSESFFPVVPGIICYAIYGEGSPKDIVRLPIYIFLHLLFLAFPAKNFLLNFDSKYAIIYIRSQTDRSELGVIRPEIPLYLWKAVAPTTAFHLFYSVDT